MSVAFLIAASLAVGAKLAPGTFTTDDYPVEALRNDSQGTVRAGVSIDAAGKVTACRVLWSSGVPSLDARTCVVLMTRGRFEPARDRRGRAIAAKESVSIKWALPEEEPSLAADNYHRATFDIAADGGLSNCHFERNGQPVADPVAACRIALSDVEAIPRAYRADMAKTWKKLSMVTGEAVGRDEDGSVARSVAGNGPMLGMAASFAIDEQGKAQNCTAQNYGSGPTPEDSAKRCQAVSKRAFVPLAKEEPNRGLRWMTSFLLFTVHN